MTRTEYQENGAEQSAQPDLTAAPFAAMGKTGVDGLIAMQSEILEEVQEASRGWFERMQAEAELASELTAKMSSAHTFPDAANVFQEWSGRRMKMAVEDAGHLFADAQKFMTIGARLLSQGVAANGAAATHAR